MLILSSMVRPPSLHSSFCLKESMTRLTRLDRIDEEQQARRRYKKDLNFLKPDLESYNKQKALATGSSTPGSSSNALTEFNPQGGAVRVFLCHRVIRRLLTYRFVLFTPVLCLSLTCLAEMCWTPVTPLRFEWLVVLRCGCRGSSYMNERERKRV